MTTKYRGVYPRKRNDGTAVDYRASITFRQKHISLGSYDSAQEAHRAYLYAQRILKDPDWTLMNYRRNITLTYDKCVCLVNFRDNNIYIPNPIYLRKSYFEYHISPDVIYKFDIDDLFYYSSHKIMQRGKHLFVADYGSQYNILHRYGIRSYSVEGRDYRFYNSDPTDLRYENVLVLNRYHGVRQYADRGFQRYKAVINIRSNFIVGHYDSEEEAAIAYNKAADILFEKGFKKNFNQNYMEHLSARQYAEIYHNVPISPKILAL